MSEARDCRGEIGIVRTALDDRLFLNQRLIFAIQTKPRLDRDREMDTERLIVHVRGYKATHFSPAYGSKLERHFMRLGAGASPVAAGSKRQLAG